MLFNSLPFAIFFPTVLALYWALRTPRRQNLLIVVASMVFYGWWEWRFLLLLGASTLTDYVCALAIARAKQRGDTGKPWLVTSLVVNLGILGVFKYYDFFVGSAEQLWLTIGWRPDLLRIVLPVGISFYTFQTLSYSVDVYRGKFEARRSLVDVAAYVMFFPQLVAGPIERASRLLPQLEQRRRLTENDIRLGLMLMLTGFLKKVVLADGSAPIAEWFYGRAARGDEIHPWEFIVGAAAFGWQIYGDFSGYSDIARGAARLMGIELVINFKQPYHARTFGELFQRWHISLATWLRDYLFNTLGGARGGIRRSVRNLVITMFLAGLWHGANWTFVLWGLLIGFYLALNQVIRPRPRRWGVGMSIVGLVIVNFQWLTTGPLFRSPDIGTAWRVYQSALFGDWSVAPPGWTVVGVLVGFVLCHGLDAAHAFYPRDELPSATRRGWMLLTFALAAAGFWVVQPLAAEPFLYFQF